MAEPRQEIGENLRREGDEAPNQKLDRRLRVVDRAGERDGEADEASSERDGRRGVVLMDDELELAMRRQSHIGDGESRAKGESRGEIGREGEKPGNEIAQAASPECEPSGAKT